MTTRDLTYWAVILIAAVAVALPLTAEVPAVMLGTRLLSTATTVHCGSAPTAFSKKPAPTSGFGRVSDGTVCHQAGKDRLLLTALGSILGLFAVYAAWQVFGHDEEEPSDPLPEAAS